MTKKDEQVVKSFAEYMKYSLDFKDNTIKSYLIAVRQLFSEYEDYSKLTTMEIIDFFTKMRKTKNPSASTVNLKITAIHEFYKYLLLTKQVKENIVVGIPRPKEEHTTIIPPSREEVLREVRKLEMKNEDALALAVQIGIFVGCRIGEVRNLELSDVNFKEGLLNLRWTKTSKLRQVAIDEETLGRIKRYCEKHGVTKGKIIRNKCGQPMSESWMYKQIQKYSKYNFHMYRHFCISGIANDINIYQAAVQAGHTSIKTTEKNYVAPDMIKQREMINKFARG